MRWSASTQQTTMALKVKVKLSRVSDILIDDGASTTVAYKS
jgi:hypothetical protein